MPVDASIPLGIQQPQPFQTLGQLLNIRSAMQQQELQRMQMQSMGISNEANQANLTERQNLRALASDPSVRDENGNVDPGKFAEKAPQVAPTIGPSVAQSLTQSQTANIANAASAFKLKGDQADRGFREASALYQDPRIVKLTQNPTPSDLSAASEAIMEAQDRSVQAGVPRAVAAVQFAPLLTSLLHNPSSVPQALKNITVAGAERSQQPGVMNSNLAPVATNQGTQFVQTNPYAPGGGYAPAPVGPAYLPPNQVTATPSGGVAITNPASGKAFDFTPAGVPGGRGAGPSGPQMNFPAGETADTQKQLQDQRIAAQTAAANAGVAHDINRTVIGLAKQGVATGGWGTFLQHVRSVTPNAFDGITPSDSATDTQIVGKMLERSALNALQGMGPQTNAGLEAQVRANGSLSYTPQAIEKIARLNDALVTGQQAYQQGLENAIGQNGSVFAKRQFDQAWGNNFDPNAYKLVNAIKDGDTSTAEQVIKEVGGRGSRGYDALVVKMRALQKLATTGGL